MTTAAKRWRPPAASSGIAECDNEHGTAAVLDAFLSALEHEEEHEE